MYNVLEAGVYRGLARYAWLRMVRNQVTFWSRPWSNMARFGDLSLFSNLMKQLATPKLLALSCNAETTLEGAI